MGTADDNRQSLSSRAGLLIFPAAAIAAILHAGPAKASEDGLSHWANGINTILNGVLQEPGTFALYNYAEYYAATEFDGSNGKKLIPGFKADIAVDGVRIMYTYPWTLGPFSFTSGIVPAPADISIKAEGHSGHATGLLDLDVEPLYVNYTSPSKTFIMYFGPDIYLPTGDYAKGNLANLGMNYLSIVPSINMTWLPTPKIELSGSANAEFNDTNPATNYHSGTAVNFEGGIHYRPFDEIPKLRFAFQGYFHKQVEDDTVNGVRYLNGFRGQEAGIGPQISYALFPRGGILFKYQRAFDVENRPSGDRYWLELAVPLFSTAEALR